ncbi:MAG: hypothetical protein GQ574_06080 [Crocinitomix sp.]|nr:hypothetical protein [Crocinitomix sp.]
MKLIFVYKNFLIALLLFGISGPVFGQSITGFVMDEDNNPLPFTKVYLKNFSSTGASTDIEGKYSFVCDLGDYDVIYKCVGFEDLEVKVTVDKQEPTVKNVYLKQQDKRLNEVEVRTKRKNVGWMIVQNVIDHKKDMIQQMDAYSCDIYIKGIETFDKKEKKNAKKEDDEGKGEKDLFQEQKDEIAKKLEGENRLNMVEINLTKHFQYPNKIKEIRNGYEKIGKPGQIYYQSTTSGEFNFYESLIRKDDLHLTPIVSPLHPSGILSYKYKLTAITTTLTNDTIYTVQISPRSVGTSTLKGELYILKSEWVLTGVDLSMHKGNLKKYDDFRIVQEYKKSDSLWLLEKQIFEYKTKYGRETVKGRTQVVYSNYIINPTFEKKYFSNEVGITTKEAYERDTTYWDEIRPIPLTVHEQRSKFVQDSLKAIYTSEVYLDSIDADFNKITALKALWFGFQHRNREKKTQWFLSSVADVIEPFNVGGLRFGPGFEYFKKWENEQWIDWYSDMTIGFNNADLRGRARLYHLYDPKRSGRYIVSYNKDAALINWNTNITDLANRENVYNRASGTLWHSIEILNGLYLGTMARLEQRSAFSLDYKFVTWIDKYIENGPPIQFDTYNAFRTTFDLSYTPGQKYMSEPNRKVVLGSRWPTFTVFWEKGWKGPFGSVVDFDYVSATIEQSFQIGTIGVSKYKLKAGTFANQDSVFYIDRKFFRKNDQSTWLRFLFVNPLQNYQNLDSSYQTQELYLEGHYIHHFNGAIINKIPFMKKTGIKTTFGGGFVYLPEHDNYFYTEAFFGAERIFKIARKRLRVGAYAIFSVSSNEFALPQEDQPKNFQFKVSFDIMDDRDLKFNF